jgi:hypothetical protein
LGKETKIRESTKITQLFEALMEFPAPLDFVDKYPYLLCQLTSRHMRQGLGEGALERKPRLKLMAQGLQKKGELSRGPLCPMECALSGKSEHQLVTYSDADEYSEKRPHTQARSKQSEANADAYTNEQNRRACDVSPNELLCKRG